MEETNIDILKKMAGEAQSCEIDNPNAYHKLFFSPIDHFIDQHSRNV